ncbi:Pentatricopeptide repeat-containing protein At4g32430, mitochondrial [Linum perenne]
MVDMLGRAGRLQEAEDLVKQIPGGPSLSVLQSLLGSCRTYGDVELGEKAADALLGMEPNESGTYVLMANLYAEKGQNED